MSAPLETGIVDPILRIDFLSFIAKCFRELNSGIALQPELAHRCHGLRAGALQDGSQQTPHYHRAAALAEVALRLNCVPGFSTGA